MSQTTIPFLLHHAMELYLDLYHTCYQNKNNFSGKVTKTKWKVMVQNDRRFRLELISITYAQYTSMISNPR